MNAESFYSQGCEKLDKGDYKGAIEDFKKAIKLSPDYWQAFLKQGIAKFKTGMLTNKDAIEDFSKAIDINPDCLDCYANRALAKKAIDDLDGYNRDFARAGLDRLG